MQSFIPHPTEILFIYNKYFHIRRAATVTAPRRAEFKIYLQL